MQQATLFDGPPQRPQPRVPARDPNIIPEDKPRLDGQNAIILELLKRGPATIDEICRASGSRKHTSRISDIRDYLRPLGQDIKCERVPGGNNVYRLVGEPKGQT